MTTPININDMINAAWGKATSKGINAPFPFIGIVARAVLNYSDDEATVTFPVAPEWWRDEKMRHRIIQDAHVRLTMAVLSANAVPIELPRLRITQRDLFIPEFILEASVRVRRMPPSPDVVIDLPPGVTFDA